MVNYKSIVKNFQKHYSDATDVVVVGNKGKVIYSTSNWSMSKDIETVLVSWGFRRTNSIHHNLGTIPYINSSNIRFCIEFIKNTSQI